MKIFFENEIYYISCNYGERNTIKSLGFKWDSDLQKWATKSFYIAVKAVEVFNLDPHEYPKRLHKYICRHEASYASKETWHYKTDAEYLPNLYDYQKAGVEQMVFDDNVLLADEPGLGKTLQVISYLALVPECLKAIIVCPASLKINWAREFKKWANIETHIVRGQKAIIPKTAKVVIVNYDLLKSKLILDQLIAMQATELVCDEAHYLSNAKTKRTKAVTKLAKIATKKIFVTGTPLLNRPINLYPLINLIDPNILTPYSDYRNYAYRFCNAYNSRFGFDVSGNSNISELAFRLRATCMIRRTKDSVLPQLPNKTIQIVPFELCKKTQKILKKEEWINIEDLKKYPERSKLGDLAKIRQELALAKLPESVAYIKELLVGAEKLVVFANHHTVLNELMAELAEYNPVLFTGKQNEKTKQKAVDEFQNNSEKRVFIGQIQAAGVGITLTAASTVVFVENTWVPSELHQAIDRLHRNGQESPVLAKILVVEESLDETILKTMVDKNKVIEKILG